MPISVKALTAFKGGIVVGTLAALVEQGLALRKRTHWKSDGKGTPDTMRYHINVELVAKNKEASEQKR
ncbi:unnamed protein product, partial [Mesorhabditis spiculigera]